MTVYQIEYGRFSDPVQGRGDSKRRQASGHAAFAKRFDLTPWPEKFNDDGKSGWSGAHRKGDFGRFLTLAKAGKFPKGSVFVIEEMDRFSREKLSLVLS